MQIFQIYVASESRKRNHILSISNDLIRTLFKDVKAQSGEYKFSKIVIFTQKA